MKNILCVILLILATSIINAQNYFGVQSDNFGGLNSVSLNPANITGSNFRSEVNLASATVSATNDYASVDLSNAFNDEVGTDNNLYPKDNNNFNLSAEVMLPSFMFNLSPKHSIGIISKVKTFANVYEINGGLFDAIEDDFNESSSFNFKEDKFNISSHVWAEFGLVYGRKLIENEKHTLKGGLNLKYLVGGGATNIQGQNLIVDFDENSTLIPGDGEITTQGEIGYSSSYDFTDENQSEELGQGSGFGADIGFVYEYRPETSVDKVTPFANYKFKFGLSITDIGSIKYKEAVTRRYDITNSVTELQYQSAGEDFEDKLDNLYTLLEDSKGLVMQLPTALHLTADYNIDTKFYVNLQTDLSLVKGNNKNSNTIANMFTVTPRFERKWFSAYVPLSMVQYSGFNAGFGFRAGPLFMGSNTILTNLMSENSKAFNVYAGLKVPIYKKGKSYIKTQQK